ncbi:uncharacterized protein [Spinacia oleracea]|uniref:Uncharacterized protein n=1 Tax=Spinacia oleracea TaxID=3562 RepID=A0ABM3QJ23_SPIOL|nr:uncharacterized protein LOC130459810 [Spinacia oleracea]
MHMENGIPNYYKYGTPDGRWRYDLEIMTTIIELTEECFDDGKTVENINLTGLDHDTKTQMDEDSDDDVVEIENPNPIIPEPTIEISSDTEIEPEVDNDEVNVCYSKTMRIWNLSLIHRKALLILKTMSPLHLFVRVAG